MALCFYSGMLGWSPALVNGSISAVWPPAGLALAATLIFGYRFWPAIFIGSVLASSVAPCPWVTSLGIATGDTLAALVGARLLRQFASGLSCFEQPRTTFKYFLLAPVFSTVISATFGVISLGRLTHGDWPQVWLVWSTWWIGNLTSDLVITPLLIIWINPRWSRWQIVRLLEGMALFCTLVLVGEFVFLGKNRIAEIRQLEFLMFPPLLWAIFRFGPRGATASVLVISSFAVWSTAHQLGPFITSDQNSSLLLSQLFIVIISIIGLLLTAVITERRKFQIRLQVKDAISRIIAESPISLKAIPDIIQVICETSEWDFGALWQIEKNANELSCAAVWSSASIKAQELEIVTRQMRFSPGIFLPGRVWSTGNSVWIKNLLQDDNSSRAGVAAKTGLKTAVGFPIKLGDELIGVIECYSRNAQEPDADFIQMLASIGNQIGHFIERGRSEEQVRKLLRAVEQSPASIMITDRTGAIEYVNPKFTSLTGYTADEVRGKNPRLLKSESEATPTADEYQQLWQTIQQGREWRGQFHNRKKNGELFWETASISPVADASGQITHFIAVKEDISEAKKMEAQLRELAAIVRSSEDAIVGIDSEGLVLSWNKGAEILFGYAGEEIVGKNISAIFPQDEFEEARQIIPRILRGESVAGYEALRQHKNGTLVAVSVKVSPVTHQGGKVTGLAAIYRDITARRQLEKNVLEISALERRRVGHELHDGLGQHLVGMAYLAKVLEQVLAKQSSPQMADAGRLVALINEAIHQTRQLANGFDPVDIEPGGLPTALKKLSLQIANRHQVICRLQCNQMHLPLNKQTNLALFRIVQEAINNAIRHGQAREIEISLQATELKISLTVSDNGKGFSLAEPNHQGMGLRIMGYRASSVGGKLSITSEENLGTQVNCAIELGSPLNHDQPSPE